jgi:hypothetical protein
MNDLGLHWGSRSAGVGGGGGADGVAGGGSKLPPREVLMSVDSEEMNRLFILSGKLDRWVGGWAGGEGASAQGCG